VSRFAPLHRSCIDPIEWAGRPVASGERFADDLGLAILLGVKNHRELKYHQLRAANLQAAWTHSRLQALRMQLNPHFLFNTLNAAVAIRWTMQQAEGTLDPGMFLRIHRSVIVNTHKIREMERRFHGEYTLTLANGQRFTSGRAYRRQIQAHLKNAR